MDQQKQTESRLQAVEQEVSTVKAMVQELLDEQKKAAESFTEMMQQTPQPQQGNPTPKGGINPAGMEGALQIITLLDKLGSRNTPPPQASLFDAVFVDAFKKDVLQRIEDDRKIRVALIEKLKKAEVVTNE